MKGVTHFIAGICAASFVPRAVEAGVAGNPLYFLLGGGAALLPDTLDFKVARYFYPSEIDIVPDATQPDAGAIADRLAQAVERVWRSGRPVTVRLCTVRLPGDVWQPYRIELARDGRQLRVVFECPCDSGGNPAGPAPRSRGGRAELPAHVVMSYGTGLRVDIMDGPVLRLERTGGDRIACTFLPWHRAWSHSLTLPGLLGLAAAALGGLAAGITTLAGALTHPLLDQAGHMGSALAWPFSRQRTPGWRRCHSADTWPNLATVWLCLLVTGMNLARLDPVAPAVFNPVRVLFWGALLPLAGVRLLLKPAA